MLVRLGSDSDQVAQAAFDAFKVMLQQSFQILGALVVMLSTSWQVTMAILVLGPPLALIMDQCRTGATQHQPPRAGKRCTAAPSWRPGACPTSRKEDLRAQGVELERYARQANVGLK